MPNQFNAGPAAMQAQGYGQLPKPWNPYQQFDPFQNATQNYEMVDRINNLFNQNPYAGSVQPYMRPGGRISTRNTGMAATPGMIGGRILMPGEGIELDESGVPLVFSQPNTASRYSSPNPYDMRGDIRAQQFDYLRQPVPTRQPSSEYLNYQSFIDKLLFPEKYKESTADIQKYEMSPYANAPLPGGGSSNSWTQQYVNPNYYYTTEPLQDQQYVSRRPVRNQPGENTQGSLLGYQYVYEK